MWIVATIFSLLVGVYGYLAFTCFFTKATFLACYRTSFVRFKDKKTSIRCAFDIFAKRLPFSVLTEEEIERLIDVLILIDDPIDIAEIVRDADRKRDVSRLADPVFLSRYKSALLDLKKKNA